MISTRLNWFLENEKFISKFQGGYQKGKSTIDHIIRLETPIREANLTKQHLIAIFFDLEKAFD